VRTEIYRRGETKINTAMTISGAAFSTGMGFYTSIAQAFATGLFNLRLGYWMLNPRVYDFGTGDFYFPAGPAALRDAAGSRSWRHVGKRDSLLRTCTVWSLAEREPVGGPDLESNAPSVRGISDFAGHPALRFSDRRAVFWSWFLMLEMGGWTNSNTALVNLSDGGHTGDNIGLYSLFQRRCKLIIACDGEADPDYSFGSLANAIRQIDVDENVSVTIDLDQLRPEPREKVAQRHFLIGKIEYPDCRPRDAAGRLLPNEIDERPGVGWLLYLKSSLTAGQLPIAVNSYAAKHKHFPHDTTVDQIFNDDQFEAYRMLGEHIANTTVDALKREDSEDDTITGGALTARQLIDWCASHYQESGETDDFEPA